MKKRTRLIRHSPLLLVAALAGCMGSDEEKLQVAYGVVRDDVPTRIIVVNDDGTDAERVTGAIRGRSPVLPAWSPDGQRIAFVRYNPAGGPGAVQVYLVNADGTGERHLGEGTLPQWTPDGRFVVVERVRLPPASSTIHVLPVDGGAGRKLTDGSAPAVSRDGSTVAFVRHTYRARTGAAPVVATSTLNTISLDGTGLRRLRRIRGPGRFIQPSWLPGDTAVAAVERQGGLGGPLVTISTSNLRRRVVLQTVGETYDWSPLGDLVAYTREGILYLVRPDGSEVDSYGQSNAIDIEFSPDGKQVAYSVLEVLQTEVDFVGLYAVDLEEKTRKRFALAEGFVAYLDWRPLPPEEDG